MQLPAYSLTFSKLMEPIGHDYAQMLQSLQGAPVKGFTLRRSIRLPWESQGWKYPR